jgi:hypothetical protein
MDIRMVNSQQFQIHVLNGIFAFPMRTLKRQKFASKGRIIAKLFNEPHTITLCKLEEWATGLCLGVYIELFLLARLDIW